MCFISTTAKVYIHTFNEKPQTTSNKSVKYKRKTFPFHQIFSTLNNPKPIKIPLH